jgi:acyl-CoA synthetase (AMP-forming)/AMP-acid ligase II
MGELNFNRLLRRSGLLFGSRPAIADLGNGHEATYAEHLERVGRLCAVLAAEGVGPRDRFAVLAGGSHVYVEAWHAALAGGGVINPLNNRLAPDELVYIIDNSGTEVILVDAGFARVIDSIRARLPQLRRVLLIGEGDSTTDSLADARLDDLMAATPPTPLPEEPADDAMAVLMYTGGTTGLPKGVVLSHRAIMLTIHRMLLELRFNEGGSYLAFMPLFHIGGVSSWGLLVPTGGRVVVMPSFEPGAAIRAAHDHRITLIGTVPTMLAMMLGHPDFEPSMLATVQNIMYGAAPMPPELQDRLLGMYPALQFQQAYGMTECASTVTMLTAADHRNPAVVRSVGRALVGVDIEIRHPETMEPLPQGEIGEIWVRCDSALTEYWRQPEQTASALVDGWYRSGDAGRLDETGYLYLADRVKDMIVSGGENVYSLEVERAISSHPAVIQVAVVGVPDPLWGEVVHAVVVCEPGAATAEELTEHARARIAGFKVPRGWTFQADPLPLSAAAKVLKRELRDRVAAALRSSPTNEGERR